MNCPQCGCTESTNAGFAKRRLPFPHKLRQHQCTGCLFIYRDEDNKLPLDTKTSSKAVAGTPDPCPLPAQTQTISTGLQLNTPRTNCTLSADEPVKTDSTPTNT